MNSNLTNPRYNYLPQMKEYDDLGQDFVLYSMFTHKKNFSGNHINTDNYGFRFSKFNNKSISVETELYSKEKINIIIGGSTVFGVGASKDDKTIASCLSKISNEKWINLGLRAGNSIQEYINLIKIIGKTDNIGKIIVLSGINDVYMNLAFNNDSNNLDDFIFDNSRIQNFMNKNYLSHFSLKRKFVASIISFLKNIEINSIIDLRSMSDMLKFNKNRKRKVNSEKISSLDKLFSIFERNFLLYSSLEKGLKTTKVTFFLQPYFNWIKKGSNQKEKEIMEYNNITYESSSLIHKKINRALYKKITKKLDGLSSKFNLKYHDLNVENLGGKDDFVFADSVHLTDIGNNKTSKIIAKYIYQKESK
tara:strand:+ start:376 stop:1464 length:1089 start_codon:yes stop_codon:yes gene_type:complete